MTELKTLKDLEVKLWGDIEIKPMMVPTNALKQEAIKWVNSHFVKNDDGSYKRINSHTFMDDWIKFFNLTEEDLHG